jgi:putative NADPH-quinone reductase
LTSILIIQGHPDAAGGHLCHVLADAYAAGAEKSGHEVRRIDVAKLRFDLMRNAAEFQSGTIAPDIVLAQENFLWANHVVLVYPLWLGTMPALLKGFLEQVLRPGFAFDYTGGGGTRQHLKGRSARVVITMGMPALIYRFYFGAHSLKSLERNILKFVGIRPVRETLFGSVETASPERRADWIARMRDLGGRAD